MQAVVSAILNTCVPRAIAAVHVDAVGCGCWAWDDSVANSPWTRRQAAGTNNQVDVFFLFFGGGEMGSNNEEHWVDGFFLAGGAIGKMGESKKTYR